ncbi:MAG: peptidoglycan-binding domain-containing protein [Patescibacteria group bacterium]
MKSFIFSVFIFITFIIPSHTFASVPRVSADPTSATLQENGGSQTFTITLDEPVIAEEGTAYATINLSSDDDRLQFSVPSITFHEGDWFTPQSFTVTVNNDHIHNANNTAHITMLTDSNSEYYSNFRNTITITLVDDDPRLTTHSGSVHYSCRDPKATNYEDMGASKSSLCIYAMVTSPLPTNTIPVPSDLSFGMKNNDVKTLQTFLIGQAKGPAARLLSTFGATGYFGQFTKEALIEWQTAESITPTGIYDAATREKAGKIN